MSFQSYTPTFIIEPEQIALRVGAFLYAFLHSQGSLQSTYERLLEMVY